MAETVTIARPYAEAIFRLARDGKTLPAWSDRLKLLAAVAQDTEMRTVVGDPNLSAGQLAQLFISLAGESANQEVGNFVTVLAENERLAVLPEIAELFEELKGAEEGVKEAVVSSAFPLDDVQLKNLTSQLEAHFNSKLHARVVVEPELIGGIKVAVGDQVLDASVRGKLDVMATALKN